MKITKLTTLSALVMSSMYLTQCTPISSTTLSSSQPTVSNSKYPTTRTHQAKEDRFMTGEFGKADYQSSEGRASRAHNVRIKPDDGVDVYFGEKIVDKYRWLENFDQINPEYINETSAERARNFIGTRNESDIPNGQLDNRSIISLQQVGGASSSEVNDWVNAQNATTTAYLERIPYLDKIRQNIDSFYNRHHSIRKMPVKAGGEIALFRGDDTETRIIYTDADGNEKTLWREKDSKYVLSGGDMFVNEDGSYVILLLSQGYSDSDQVKLHVYEVATGKEVITPVIVGNFGQAGLGYINVNWYDNDTFFYTDLATNPGSLLRHDIGVKRLDDPIETSSRHIETIATSVSFADRDKRYMVLNTLASGSSAFLIKDLHTGKYYRPYSQKQVDKKRDYAEGFIIAKYMYLDDKTGDLWLVSGENDEQRGEIIKTNLHNLKKREVVVPANPNYDTINSAIYHNEGDGYFVINYLKDGQHRVILTNHKGEALKDLSPSLVGQATDLLSYVVGKETGKENTDAKEGDENHISFRFQNPVLPRTVYKYSVNKGEFIDVRRRDLFPFDHTQYETKLVKYKSKDGTEVPMTISYKKGTVLNGQNPTLLHAYGGFNVNVASSFSMRNAPWLEHGGIFAQAHIRGGGELGEAWHKAGMLQNKLNVFDDFESAADYLTEQGYTSPDYLAITGGSNGGLLVGAAMTLSPDKYRVAFPQIGVLDMLRHDQFTYIGLWDGEYGSAYDSPSMYRYLKAYSPYHNIKSGVCYPSTVVMTSKRDDRVLPAHSYKFAAALQEHQSCDNPTLLHTDEDQGHGARAPKPLKEAMLLNVAFALHEMGVKDVPVVNRLTVEQLKGEKWLKEEAKEKAK